MPGLGVWAWLCASPAASLELKAPTELAWQRYVRLSEARIEAELASPYGFLVNDFLPRGAREVCEARLARGQVCIERLVTPGLDGKHPAVPEGLIHHWLGTIVIPDAELDELLAWIQDYDRQALHFDEVVESRTLARDADTFLVFLKLRRKKVLTVYYATEHTVRYTRHGPTRVSSHSLTTRVAELEEAGTGSERRKPPQDDRGFLWHLDSYWRFEQHGDCVYVSCESLSLSRDIPAGLGWLLGGYVETIPRESLESTLVSLRDGFRGR